MTSLGGVPDEIIDRHPFPGPGFAVRIIGEVTPEKVEILQKADRIIEEEIKRDRIKLCDIPLVIGSRHDPYLNEYLREDAAWLLMIGEDPIIPDGYIIRYNETASELDEDYYFLNFTTQLTYTHTFVAQYSPQMFYRVIAVKDYSREQIEYLEGLNNSREKIKWSIVQQNLKEIK